MSAESTSTASADGERQAAAREVVRLLKKALHAFRSYKSGHGARTTATHELFQALATVTASHGGLALQVTSRAFYCADEPVSAEEAEDESTTRPLFTEGIQGLTFLPSLRPDELERFLSLWHIAAHARFPEGRSLTTELWEADFHGIATSIVENLSESAEADVVTDDVSAARLRHERIMALTEDMRAARLPGSKVDDGSSSHLVSSADLLPLTTSSALVTDELVKRFFTPRQGASGILDDEECRALAAALSESAETLARAHRTLWRISPDGDPGDDEKIHALVPRITLRFLEDGSLDVLRQGLSQTLVLARRTPHRAPEIARFFETLAVPDVVTRLVAATRDQARRADAVAVLAFLSPAHMGLVLERIESVADVPEARDALLQLVGRKGPDTELFWASIAGCKTPWAAATTTALLETLSAIRPEALVQVLSSCLAHPRADVRRAALAQVSVELVSSLAASLTKALVRETDLEVQRELLSWLMKAKRQETVGALVTLLRRVDVDVEHRLTYLRALAHFGGRAASEAAASLRQMFQEERDVDVRCSTALTLGSIGDENARALLASEAKRFLTPGVLKAACLEALSRLDARMVAGDRSDG